MNKKILSAILPLVLLGPAHGAEEEKPKEGPPKPLVPLKLQVVFSRYQGEKKVSSLPYILSVNSEGRPARLRMGIQVPIQTMANNTPTVQYKDASNNLDCSVETLDAGRFKVSCSLEQGSIYEAEGRSVSLPSGPMLRTFRSETDLLLRDGQTAQYTAATDPVSGEMLKIDMTLTVVK
jgi:hypothetical protein